MIAWIIVPLGPGPRILVFCVPVRGIKFAVTQKKNFKNYLPLRHFVMYTRFFCETILCVLPPHIPSLAFTYHSPFDAA